MMKASIPRPVHESYLKHRRELAWQIILPVVLTSLLIVALIVLIINVTFFQGAGDLARWAAISTIWIVVPIMIAGLVILAVLGGLIYLMIRLLQLTPTYTGLAQHYVHKAAVYVKRAADAVVRPIFFLDEIGTSVRALFGRK